MFARRAYRKKKPVALPSLEASLDMPLKELLALMRRQTKKRTTYFGIEAIK
jgi:hypothetical protein